MKITIINSYVYDYLDDDGDIEDSDIVIDIEYDKRDYRISYQNMDDNWCIYHCDDYNMLAGALVNQGDVEYREDVHDALDKGLRTLILNLHLALIDGSPTLEQMELGYTSKSHELRRQYALLTEYTPTPVQVERGCNDADVGVREVWLQHARNASDNLLSSESDEEYYTSI